MSAGGATPAERLSTIVEQGLCIGCGICQVIAGPDRISVGKTGQQRAGTRQRISVGKATEPPPIPADRKS